LTFNKRYDNNNFLKYLKVIGVQMSKNLNINVCHSSSWSDFSFAQKTVTQQQINDITQKSCIPYSQDILTREDMYTILETVRVLTAEAKGLGGFDKLDSSYQEMLSTAVDFKFARAISSMPNVISLSLGLDNKAVGEKYGYLYKDTQTVSVGCQAEIFDVISILASELLIAGKIEKAQEFFTLFAISSSKFGTPDLTKQNAGWDALQDSLKTFLGGNATSDFGVLDAQYTSSLGEKYKLSVDSTASNCQTNTCVGHVLPALERPEYAKAGTRVDLGGILVIRGYGATIGKLYEGADTSAADTSAADNYAATVREFYKIAFKMCDKSFLNLVLKPTVKYYTRMGDWTLIDQMVLDYASAATVAKDMVARMVDDKTTTKTKSEKEIQLEKFVALSSQDDDLLQRCGFDESSQRKALEDIKDELGNTPAHQAAKDNDKDALVKILKHAPSLAEVENNSGERPRDLIGDKDLSPSLAAALHLVIPEVTAEEALNMDDVVNIANGLHDEIYAKGTAESIDTEEVAIFNHYVDVVCSLIMKVQLLITGIAKSIADLVDVGADALMTAFHSVAEDIKSYALSATSHLQDDSEDYGVGHEHGAANDVTTDVYHVLHDKLHSGHDFEKSADAVASNLLDTAMNGGFIHEAVCLSRNIQLSLVSKLHSGLENKFTDIENIFSGVSELCDAAENSLAGIIGNTEDI
jgi:hypothetical protein